MALYFDGTHLASSDNDAAELHAKAAQVGLKREWFQPHCRHPHYDASGICRRRLLSDPAVMQCSSKKLLRQCRQERP